MNLNIYDMFFNHLNRYTSGSLQKPTKYTLITVDKAKNIWYNNIMRNSQIGLFDEDKRMARLNELKDPLEKLNAVINWEMFREVLTRVCQKEDTGKCGRPPFDVILKFKMVVLQRLYNLSYDNLEYMVTDRLSFMRFLGLGLNDAVPDSNTIWIFVEKLTKAGVMYTLFDIFNKMLEDEKLITHKGTIVDATFVEAPRQRNKREEKKISR